jgi:hypothetical protein
MLTTDPAFTLAVMQLCHALGHCVLSNQALRYPQYTPDSTVYDEMSILHSQSPSSTLIDFQTVSPKNIGNWCGAIGTESICTAYHTRCGEITAALRRYLMVPRSWLIPPTR